MKLVSIFIVALLNGCAASVPAHFQHDLICDASSRPEPSPLPDYGSLSSGGYRAMLFHLGALWRLNDLGLLRSLDGVASVSAVIPLRPTRFEGPTSLSFQIIA